MTPKVVPLLFHARLHFQLHLFLLPAAAPLWPAMAATQTVTLTCVNPKGTEVEMKVDSTLTVRELLKQIKTDLGWTWCGVTSTAKGAEKVYGKKLDEDAVLRDVVVDGATLKALRPKKGVLVKVEPKGASVKVEAMLVKAESEVAPVRAEAVPVRAKPEAAPVTAEQSPRATPPLRPLFPLLSPRTLTPRRRPNARARRMP